MLCLGTDCLILSDMTKGYGRTYLDYVSFSSAKIDAQQVSVFCTQTS